MSIPLTPKEHASALIGYLKPEVLAALIPLLETMVSRSERHLAAIPWDDEVPSEEEEQAAAESRLWLETHEGIPHEVVLAEYGLTPEDFKRMGRELLSVNEEVKV